MGGGRPTIPTGIYIVEVYSLAVKEKLTKDSLKETNNMRRIVITTYDILVNKRARGTICLEAGNIGKVSEIVGLAPEVGCR